MRSCRARRADRAAGNVTSATSVAPWQAASASLRQMVGWRSRLMGSSGKGARFSRYTSATSAATAMAASTSMVGRVLALMRCACSSASSAGTMNADEQDQSHAVEGPGLLARGTRRQAQRQQGRHHAERQVDEEHAAPAEMMREIAAGHGPERAGRDHHGGQVALVARALARRDGLADQRLRQRHQAAAAEPLQDAREAQHLDAGRHRAQQRGDKEDAERDEHHALAAVDVAQLAVDGRGDGAGDEIGRRPPTTRARRRRARRRWRAGRWRRWSGPPPPGTSAA